jgi:VWFA-related protein
MLRREFVSSAAALLFLKGLARAQAQDEPTFSANVRVVNVLATVRDKKGGIIKDLSKDDFTVSENGRPQVIRYFSRETDIPLTLGLMVDTSMSQQKVLDAERGASFRFFDQVLREKKDHFFIMQFDMGVLTRQELTDSRAKLDEALSYVDTPPRSQLMLNGYGPGTVLYDAVVKSSANVMQNQTGRKALVVLSDGVDNGSESTITEAIEAAERADTIIYSILFSDEGFYSGGRDGKGALMKLAKETGGGFFEVTKKVGIEKIFAELEDELRSQYSLGYVSDQPAKFTEYRKIQVATKTKNQLVQARDRYWARP